LIPVSRQSPAGNLLSGKPGGKLSLLFIRHDEVTLPAAQHHRPIGNDRVWPMKKNGYKMNYIKMELQNNVYKHNACQKFI